MVISGARFTELTEKGLLDPFQMYTDEALTSIDLQDRNTGNTDLKNRVEVLESIVKIIGDTMLFGPMDEEAIRDFCNLPRRDA